MFASESFDEVTVTYPPLEIVPVESIFATVLLSKFVTNRLMTQPLPRVRCGTHAG